MVWRKKSISSKIGEFVALYNRPMKASEIVKRFRDKFGISISKYNVYAAARWRHLVRDTNTYPQTFSAVKKHAFKLKEINQPMSRPLQIVQQHPTEVQIVEKIYEPKFYRQKIYVRHALDRIFLNISQAITGITVLFVLWVIFNIGVINRHDAGVMFGMIVFFGFLNTVFYGILNFCKGRF